jgi:uncharacterized protein
MLRLAPGGRRGATIMYLRRLGFLLVVGVLHGALLYHGDILVPYALGGLVLLPFAWRRARALLRAMRVAVLVIATGAAWAVAIGSLPGAASTGRIPDAIARDYAVYLGGDYPAQLARRWPRRWRRPSH